MIHKNSSYFVQKLAFYRPPSSLLYMIEISIQCGLIGRNEFSRRPLFGQMQTLFKIQSQSIHRPQR